MFLGTVQKDQSLCSFMEDSLDISKCKYGLDAHGALNVGFFIIHGGFQCFAWLSATSHIDGIFQIFNILDYFSPYIPYRRILSHNPILSIVCFKPSQFSIWSRFYRLLKVIKSGFYTHCTLGIPSFLFIFESP